VGRRRSRCYCVERSVELRRCLLQTTRTLYVSPRGVYSEPSTTNVNHHKADVEDGQYSRVIVESSVGSVRQ
jgi:hypothetical protein